MQPYLFPYIGYFQLIEKCDHFVFLDDENGNYIPVEDNDWVITSYPFCGNGIMPPHFDQLQDDCLEKNVPLGQLFARGSL